MKPKAVLKSLAGFLNTRPPVGGLEITDQVLRFVDLSSDAPQKISVILPAGTIIDGRIKNNRAFAAALKDLRKKLKFYLKPVNVALSFFDPEASARIFSVPASLSDKNLDEAIALNLSLMTSGGQDGWWRGISYLGGRVGRHDYLATFLSKEPINDLMIKLETEGFNVVAFEPTGVSLARLSSRWGNLGINSEPYIIISLGDSGVSLIFIANHRLYGTNSYAWKNITGGGADAKSGLIELIREDLNFYDKQFSLKAKSLALVAPKNIDGLEEGIVEATKINVLKVSADKRALLGPEWFAALGAAYYGRWPFDEIKFNGFDYDGRYLRGRVIYAIKRWRNIFAGLLISLFLFSILASVLLSVIKNSEEKKLISGLSPATVEELARLQVTMGDFNQLTSIFNWLAGDEALKLSPTIASITNAAGAAVVIEHLSFSNSKEITVSGRATGESAVLAFRQKLEKIKNVSRVSLPLSSLKPLQDGSVLFTVAIIL